MAPPRVQSGWSDPEHLPFEAPDVACFGTGPGDMYYCRPHTIVVPEEGSSEAEFLLGPDWRRRWDAADPRTRHLGVVGLRGEAVHRDHLLEQLDRVCRRVPEARPNHVLVGQPKYQGFPLARPRPAPRPELVHDEEGYRPLVVVVDTGVSGRSPMAARGWIEWEDPIDREFLDADADGRLDLQGGHATFVAGVVKAKCPRARIRVVRALDSRGIGDDLSLAEALLRVALDMPEADVVNLSFGGYAQGDVRPPALAAALRRIRANGALVVAAAGNDDTSRRLWPAGAVPDECVAVAAATDAGGRWGRCSWSNHGAWVDAFCEGDGVRSAFVEFDGINPAGTTGGDGDYDGGAIGSGTSFAAPALAGLVAAEMTGRGGAEDALGRLGPVATVDAAPGQPRPVYR